MEILQPSKLTFIAGSVGNIVGYRFCNPGSTPAGVEIFLHIEMQQLCISTDF